MGFLHPHKLRSTIDCLVCASGLPIPRHCCSVRPHPVWVLSVSWTKEIPFIFSKLCFIWIPRDVHKKKMEQGKNLERDIVVQQVEKKAVVSDVTIYLAIPMDQTCRDRLLG
ncbi:hypothetical protein V8G54_001907 [Vigna mungo]|uniref:Uncharacterized protein n=1 Tax=Vigna mungo TaxID=3915 RepID=A0AAQ3PB91_VIGMU